MKRTLAVAILVALALGFNSRQASAQIHVNVNIGVQPAWGPVGYDYAQFYYFPDYDFYYDIVQARYVVWERGRWVFLTGAPIVNFNPYRMYKVVINKPKAWMFHDAHIRQYASFKGRGPQPMIRDSRDERYFESKYHPNHSQWQKQQGNGNANGHYKGNPGMGNPGKSHGNNGNGGGKGGGKPGKGNGGKH